MRKDEIIRILEDIAGLLELQGENPFKVRAYRRGARALAMLDADLKDLVRKGTLTEIAGIGEHLAERIGELVRTGRLRYYEQLQRSIPKALLELTQLPGLGPKKAKILYTQLKIKSLAGLKKAAEEGKLSRLKGFGPKTEKNLLAALDRAANYQKRRLWVDAFELALPLVKQLNALKSVREAEAAGSLRRKLETVGDLDIVAGAPDPETVVRWFCKQPFVRQVLATGPTKASVLLDSGIQADLRAVLPAEYPFALLYFTGSKEHNVELRKRALKQGYSLSEYGVKSVRKTTPPLFKKPPNNEEEIYKAFGLSYIPPELREGLGEIEAAERKALPRLVELKDLKGSFHTHTTESDGKSPLEEMIREAEHLGWEYIGISDHSVSAFQANGLSEEKLEAEFKAIKALNKAKRYAPYVFSGVECDILADGSLDCSDAFLKQCDFTVVSVHSSLQLSEAAMTRRIIRAIEHPFATMLGHPTGRLLLQREPYSVNLPKIIDACIANGTIIELNCNPLRLDMDWRLWKKASERGLLCSLNTDAHHKDHLRFLELGVYAARKGWLEPKQVVNTRSLKEIRALLAKKR